MAVSLWYALAVFASLMLISAVAQNLLSLWSPVAANSGSRPPWCGRCGYSLFGLGEASDRCPECGAEFEQVAITTNLQMFDIVYSQRLRTWTRRWLILSFAALVLLLPGYRYETKTEGFVLEVCPADHCEPTVHRYELRQSREVWAIGTLPLMPLTNDFAPQSLHVYKDDEIGGTLWFDSSSRAWWYTSPLRQAARVSQPPAASDLVRWLNTLNLAHSTESLLIEADYMAEYLAWKCNGRPDPPDHDCCERSDHSMELVRYVERSLPATVVFGGMLLLVWLLGAVRIRRRLMRNGIPRSEPTQIGSSPLTR